LPQDTPNPEQPTSPDAPGLTRRDFLRLAGGVVVLFSLGPEARSAVTSTGTDQSAGLGGWLRIGPDSRVTVFTPTPEVGQGLRTSLAQIAADELSLPMSSIDIIMGDTDRVPAQTPADHGSAVATIGPRLRAAAAQARSIIAELAAARWDVDPEAVQVRDGLAAVADDPERSVAIGELARGRRLVRRPSDMTVLEPSGEHRLVGQSVPRVDGPEIVTGTVPFVGDLRLPDMVYAKLLRPPCLDARLVGVDARAAARQSGVVAVVQQGDFVAVVAERPDLAEKALRLVRASWEEPGRPHTSSLYDDMRRSAKLTDRTRHEGDADAALAAAQYGFSATYRTAFVAHAPIEPHGAVAAQEADRIIVHASTQRPFLHRDAVSRAFDLPPERVRVIAAPVGGAFGGKDEGDVSVAAVRLARAVRRPVMLTYSREEEFTWGYFRPAALIDVQCGANGDGDITAWACDAFNCGPRGADPPYAFPNQRVDSYDCDVPLRQGHWRGDGGPANTFAREVHLDHVASELGHDPVGFRLRHLTADERMARVVRTAAEAYGWREARAPTGLGVGFACAADSGAFVAQIAEVEVSRVTGEVRVRRVLTAHDCGLIINPDGLRNQIEGAVIMGLGFTLREAVRYEQGRILSDTFASYAIPTIRDTPALETMLIPNPDRPARGAGTAAIFPIAAAVTNAVFDATGRRLRELPLSPERVRAGMTADDQ